MYTLLGATLALTACVEDDKDLSQPKEPEKRQTWSYRMMRTGPLQGVSISPLLRPWQHEWRFIPTNHAPTQVY